MHYLISDLSRITGMSIEGIRKYEKEGIIAPQRSENGQYRIYDYLDITSMMRSRMYRALGFSLKETGELINDASLEQARIQLEQKKGEIAREEELLLLKRKLLEEMIEELAETENSLGKISICKMPAYYRIEFSKNGEIQRKAPALKLVRQRMEYMPFVHVSTRYSGKDTFGGVAIRDTYASFFHIAESDQVQYIPSGEAFRIYVCEGDNAFASCQYIEALQRFASEHHFVVDECLGHSVTSLYQSSQYRRYRAIFARIHF